MATFVLVDHSLKDVGGHHFDYAVQLLEAAEDAGMSVALAANRRFRGAHLLPRPWRVYRLFRHTTYSPFAVHQGSRSRTAQTADLAPLAVPWSGEWLGRMCHWTTAWSQWARQRRINHFVAACRRLFSTVRLDRDDHVFFPTISEFDLLGLVRYLRSDARSRLPNWHLQFHFHLLEGREPDYPRQDARLHAMRRSFLEALSQVPRHRLHLYNTSPQLAAQYNRLGVARFHPLPYPINRVFAAENSRDRASATPRTAIRNAASPRAPVREASTTALPLRVTCAGAIRQEKGQQLLGGVVRDLWGDYFAEGKLQLVIQSNKSWFRIPLPDEPKSDLLGDATDKPHDIPNSEPKRAATPPVVYVRHPLQPADYAQLITSTDIGLLLYDSERYYARHAGVLGEMLSAGVPVIVPAGCWLSEQIAEPNYAHIDTLLERLRLVARIPATSVLWRNLHGTLQRAGTSAPYLAFGDALASATGELLIPDGASEMVVTFHWVRPEEPGRYVRLAADQYDAEGNRVARSATIVGRREGERPVPVFVPLRKGAARVRLSWQNAYDDGLLTVADADVHFLSSVGIPGGVAAGSVGLIAAHVGQLPDLVREMFDHYAHYRATAQAFAQQWVEEHDPHRTLNHILARASSRSDDLVRRTRDDPDTERDPPPGAATMALTRLSASGSILDDGVSACDAETSASGVMGESLR